MKVSENPGRLEAWVYGHSSWLVALLIVIVIPLSGVTGWLVIDEIRQGQKLRGVSVAGPCRAYGIQNDECQRQARKIFAACYVQQEECWDKYGLPRRRLPDRVVARGGGALQQPSSTAPQQPGPQDGGPGDQDGGRDPEGSPPAFAPPPPAASTTAPVPAPTSPTPPAPEAPPEKSALEEVVGVVEDLPCSLPVELCP